MVKRQKDKEDMTVIWKMGKDNKVSEGWRLKADKDAEIKSVFFALWRGFSEMCKGRWVLSSDNILSPVSSLLFPPGPVFPCIHEYQISFWLSILFFFLGNGNLPFIASLFFFSPSLFGSWALRLLLWFLSFMLFLFSFLRKDGRVFFQNQSINNCNF